MSRTLFGTSNGEGLGKRSRRVFFNSPSGNVSAKAARPRDSARAPKNMQTQRQEPMERERFDIRSFCGYSYSFGTAQIMTSGLSAEGFR